MSTTITYQKGDMFEIGYSTSYPPVLRFRKSGGDWLDSTGVPVFSHPVTSLDLRLPVHEVKQIFNRINFEPASKYPKFPVVETHGVLHIPTNTLVCKSDEQGCSKRLQDLYYSKPGASCNYKVVELTQ
jgi:hypothetical protein